MVAGRCARLRRSGNRRLSIDFARDAPNVVTAVQFNTLLQGGYDVDIIARGEPELRGAFWYGDWIVAIVDRDRMVQRLLVKTRTRSSVSDEIELRDIKTANGVLSFMYKLGFRSVSIPLAKDGRTSHRSPFRSPDGTESETA